MMELNSGVSKIMLETRSLILRCWGFGVYSNDVKVSFFILLILIVLMRYTLYNVWFCFSCWIFLPLKYVNVLRFYFMSLKKSWLPTIDDWSNWKNIQHFFLSNNIQHFFYQTKYPTYYVVKISRVICIFNYTMLSGKWSLCSLNTWICHLFNTELLNWILSYQE